ncbi:MAG: methylmalonyl-CoA mutase family protein [Solirubrobacterales bacterium]
MATGVPIDTHDRGHADLLRPDPVDQVSTSMTINLPAAVLLLLYELVGEEQGVASEQLCGTVQNDVLKEHGLRQLHLPAGADDAAHDRHLRVLPVERPEVEHDLDQRGYHIREKGCSAVR